MEQKIPRIDEIDIKRIVKRDFSQEEREVMESILKGYKSDSEAGKNRMYAAILKLSNGNLGTLKKLVEKANFDYRDIIALAEYPNYSKYAFNDRLSKQEKRKLIEEDWLQYSRWFDHSNE